MAYRYLEPIQAPRGQEIVDIEARKRALANARLAHYTIPLFNDNVVGHRQVIDQRKRKPLAPYTSPVSEGLLSLIRAHESGEYEGGV